MLTCSACPLCCRHLLHPEEEDWSEDEDGSIAFPVPFPSLLSCPPVLLGSGLGLGRPTTSEGPGSLTHSFFSFLIFFSGGGESRKDLGCPVFPPVPHVVTEGFLRQEQTSAAPLCMAVCSMWGLALFCLRHNGQVCRAPGTKTLKSIRGDWK